MDFFREESLLGLTENVLMQGMVLASYYIVGKKILSACSKSASVVVASVCGFSASLLAPWVLYGVFLSVYELSHHRIAGMMNDGIFIWFSYINVVCLAELDLLSLCVDRRRWVPRWICVLTAAALSILFFYAFAVLCFYSIDGMYAAFVTSLYFAIIFFVAVMPERIKKLRSFFLPR